MIHYIYVRLNLFGNAEAPIFRSENAIDRPNCRLNRCKSFKIKAKHCVNEFELYCNRPHSHQIQGFVRVWHNFLCWLKRCVNDFELYFSRPHPLQMQGFLRVWHNLCWRKRCVNEFELYFNRPLSLQMQGLVRVCIIFVLAEALRE